MWVFQNLSGICEPLEPFVAEIIYEYNYKVLNEHLLET